MACLLLVGVKMVHGTALGWKGMANSGDGFLTGSRGRSRNGKEGYDVYFVEPSTLMVFP